MKDLSTFLDGVKSGIKLKRKAPNQEKIEGRHAALSKMAPLGVFSAKLFKCDAIIQDRNAVMVYLALCNHASKVGLTECSQERIAAMSGASVRTVARKIIKLQQHGLIRKEYSRPIRGNPMHRLNVMRVIFDDGTMTRQDVQNIASVTGQKKVAGNAATNGQTYPQPGNQILTVTGQTTVSDNYGPDNQSLQLPAKSTLCVTGQINVADKQSKDLNNRTTSQQDEYTTASILSYWRGKAKHRGREVIPNEADFDTAQALIDQAVPLRLIQGAICDHCLDAIEAGRPPAVRLKPAVAELLATR